MRQKIETMVIIELLINELSNVKFVYLFGTRHCLISYLGIGYYDFTY